MKMYRFCIHLYLILCLLGVDHILDGDDVMASPPSSSHTVIKSLIQDAIVEGSRLYNRGQADACVSVYTITLKAIQLLNPQSEYHSSIQNTLDYIKTTSAQKAAWQLRYLLDQIDQSPTLDFHLNTIQNWSTLNDSVMGGISEGAMTQDQPGVGIFTGQLSLENRGGFSSTRSPVFLGMFKDQSGVILRVRGDHHTYTFLASTNTQRGSWQRDFTVTSEWQDLFIPFSEMTLSIRGWTPPNPPSLQPELINRIGLLIKDKDESPFRLEIKSIKRME